MQGLDQKVPQLIKKSAYTDKFSSKLVTVSDTNELLRNSFLKGTTTSIVGFATTLDENSFIRSI